MHDRPSIPADITSLSCEIFAVLEDMAGRTTPLDVCRAAGLAIGNYLMASTVTHPDMGCGLAFNAALDEAATQFADAFTEVYIDRHGRAELMRSPRFLPGWWIIPACILSAIIWAAMIALVLS